MATAIADHFDRHARQHRVLSVVTAANAEGSAEQAMSLANAIRERGVGTVAPAILSGSVAAGN